MKRIYAVEHNGVWLNGYSIVVANSKEDAEDLMIAELVRLKLKPYIFAIKEIDPTTPAVHMLFNGDY